MVTPRPSVGHALLDALANYLEQERLVIKKLNNFLFSFFFLPFCKQRGERGPAIPFRFMPPRRHALEPGPLIPQKCK